MLLLFLFLQITGNIKRGAVNAIAVIFADPYSVQTPRVVPRVAVVLADPYSVEKPRVVPRVAVILADPNSWHTHLWHLSLPLFLLIKLVVFSSFTFNSTCRFPT